MQEATDVEDDSLAKPKEPNLGNFEENLKHPNSEKKILDGGYGWIVTFASFNENMRQQQPKLPCSRK